MKRSSLNVLIFILGLSLMFALGQTYAGDGGKVIDRVCKMQINKDGAKTYKKDGHKYYFCSKYCKKAFKNDPEKYACICPSSSDGCNCGHCTGNVKLCGCAEIAVHTGSHSGRHEHEEEDEGGGHHH